MSSPWTDLDRPPLSASRIAAAVVGGPLWRSVQVVERTVSTNADVVAAARAGAAEGMVLIAEEQAGGRGRLDRTWQSPPRSGLLMSLLLAPGLRPAALPLLSLVTGVAVVEAVRAVGGVDAVLKWPNDVMVGDRKLGGILVERADDRVVVGVGVNVSTRRDELPVETATSLALEGGRPDREPLAKEVLRAFARRYTAFRDSGGESSSILPAYRAVCETIGRTVMVELPGGDVVTGTAVDVDDAGMLVVRDVDGRRTTWSAGDVVHLRGGD